MENETIGLDVDFDGIFRFSNNSDEDFVKLWNSVEYTFPAHTRSPMIIRAESPENVQEIRKRFAYAWAEREWFKSADYKRMSQMGSGLPPTRDDKVLEPLIQMCLDPLPEARATIKETIFKEPNLKATKAVGKDDNLNQAFAKETEDRSLMRVGVQSDK